MRRNVSCASLSIPIIFQIPLVVLLPTSEAATRLQRQLSIEGARVDKYNVKDFSARFPVEEAPIVLVGNVTNHVAPTAKAEPKDVEVWRLDAVGKLCQATLQIASDVKGEYLDPIQVAQLTLLKSELSNSINLFLSKRDPKEKKKTADLVARKVSNPAHVPPPSAPVEKGRKRYPCTICAISFSRKNNLQDHLRNAHNISEDPDEVTCKQCNKKFAAKRSLLRHIKNAHDNVFRFVCEEHNIKTDNIQVWDGHQNKCHKESVVSPRVYKCKYCGKTFVGAHLLQKHQSRKTCKIVKKYQCDKCAKRFKTRGSLAIHIIEYHTKPAGKKQKWLCSKCKKPFYSKEALRKHIKQAHKAHTILSKAKSKTRPTTTASNPTVPPLDQQEVAAELKSLDQTPILGRLRSHKKTSK